jgi:hypothetical protein
MKSTTSTAYPGEQTANEQRDEENEAGAHILSLGELSTGLGETETIRDNKEQQRAIELCSWESAK